jgi:acetyl esterase/lipase
MHRAVSMLILSALPALAIAQPQPSADQPPKPATASPADVYTIKDLVYADPDHHPQKLDIYMPASLAKADQRPLVVWIHGGGWQAGNKDHCPALALVREGFVVASIDYRLTDTAIYPAQIHDCKAAIRWLRAHAEAYHIDVNHVGAWGASAGGHLVALLGTSGDVKELEGDEGNLDQSSRVQAVCDWFGPTDLLKFSKEAEQAKFPNPQAAEEPHSMVGKLFGGAIKDKAELAKSANPITFITKDDPPFLIMHGDKDLLVPLAQSQDLLDALKSAGVEATLDVIKDGGHGSLGPGAGKKVHDFFVAKLKPAKQPEGGKPSSTPSAPAGK